ncbi:MAG: hypothetical protein ACERK9_13095, partial [Deltaproteobacteria bacterium]
PRYQTAEIVRYAEHICNYDVILDSWFYGKISVQLIGHKRAEYVMFLCNPCGCKQFPSRNNLVTVNYLFGALNSTYLAGFYFP